jgi:hypothetical protein
MNKNEYISGNVRLQFDGLANGHAQYTNRDCSASVVLVNINLNGEDLVGKYLLPLMTMEEIKNLGLKFTSKIKTYER